jgi:dextranase
MTFELLPVLSTYQPVEPPQIEIRGLPESGTLRVFHLGDQVDSRSIEADGTVSLASLPPGGYGIEVGAGDAVARTAIEVIADGSERMRYGFVADYRPGRNVDGVRDNVRRLHLTDIQFYDWAYRHADLIGGGEEYADALGQKISLATVRDLISAVHSAGARALGYAAVYGVGNDEWSAWADAALLTPMGEPYGLGDFLRLVDPAEPGWLVHFTSELRAAADRLGFDGFHLDQYGYPKYAIRPDGVPVRVEDSFALLIAAARAELPAGRLVFNNVNTFPVWRTAGTAQDAVYVEVWAPHTTLDHLARVVRDAQTAGGGKPVVIAAYQHVYDTTDASSADLASAFTMATLFSHGATHLLCGEADRVLVDPYYVRNHVIEASTAAHLVRWYDFLVEHGELLYDASLTEMTGALAGAYNDDCDVTFSGVDVTETATAGALWRRIVGSGDRLIVHLINLSDQRDTEWDAARAPIESLPPGVLRMRRAGGGLPRVRVADPDRQPRLRDLPVAVDGDYVRVDVPAPYVWQMLVIDLRPAADVVGMPSPDVVEM